MMKVLERFYFIVLVILMLSFFYGCEKEEDLNKLPSVPKLIEPQLGTVVNSDNIKFSWQCEDNENDDIQYTLYISDDSLNWEEKYTINNLSVILNSSGNSSDWDYYVFNKGEKYFWKVKAENHFSGSVPDQESGESISEVSYFYRTPPGVNNLRDTSGHEFVNFYWEDPENLDYIEISVEPAVNGISQPIKVNAGVNKYEFRGLENGEIYSFYLNAYNNLGHVSETDTIKALPLGPMQVHDADFNVYNITQIGDQTWLRENLRTSRWQDGTQMTSNYKVSNYSDIYGYHYWPNSTFGEDANGKNPCPCGFHVPSDNEWKELERFLGMSESEIEEFWSADKVFRGEENNISSLLKTTAGWLDNNGANANGTDNYMFNLLPSGFFTNEYEFGGEISILFSSTKADTYYGTYYIGRYFSNKSTGIGRNDYYVYGSIRCVKD